MHIFSFLKKAFTNWYELAENKDTYLKNSSFMKPPFKKCSIDENDDREMTYEEFKAMDIEG